MKLNTCLLASALLTTPIAANAQAADCGAELQAVAGQIEATSVSANTVQTGSRAQPSGWAITWNRMATASQNENAATLDPANVSVSGSQGGLQGNETANGGQPAFATGRANTLVSARESVQAARAAHARGDDAACQRQVADARALLDSLS